MKKTKKLIVLGLVAIMSLAVFTGIIPAHKGKVSVRTRNDVGRKMEGHSLFFTEGYKGCCPFFPSDRVVPGIDRRLVSSREFKGHPLNRDTAFFGGTHQRNFGCDAVGADIIGDKSNGQIGHGKSSFQR